MKLHISLNYKSFKDTLLVLTCIIWFLIQAKSVYANDPPTADAGLDLIVEDTDNNGLETVTLDGSGSADSDGTIENYRWERRSDSGSTGDD